MAATGLAVALNGPQQAARSGTVALSCRPESTLLASCSSCKMASDQFDGEVEEVALVEAGGVFGNACQQGVARHRRMHVGRAQESDGVLRVGDPRCAPGGLPRGFDARSMNPLDQRPEHA
jgi:hypothetical protein